MRPYITILGILAGLACSTGSAHAQQFKSVPVDTNALIVKPVDTTTSIVGNTFRYFSRVAANVISNDGYIKTINNLFGIKKTDPAVQNGISPLPDPSRYPSTYYNSPIKPEFPKYGTIGRR